MRKLLEKFNIHTKADAKALILQVIKFGIVGLSNTCISLGVYYIFVAVNSDWYMWGNFVGFIVSVAWAFFWNKRVVFRQEALKGKDDTTGVWIRIIKPLLKSYAAYGATFLLSQGLLFLQVNQWGISQFVAPIINLIITIPLNFLINKFWTFK